jgi:hypothetical protein
VNLVYQRRESKLKLKAIVRSKKLDMKKLKVRKRVLVWKYLLHRLHLLLDHHLGDKELVLRLVRFLPLLVHLEGRLFR